MAGINAKRFAEYLDSCLNDLLGAKGEREVAVPEKVCTAVMSLIDYLVNISPGLLPKELEDPVIHINNALGEITVRHARAKDDIDVRYLNLED